MKKSKLSEFQMNYKWRSVEKIIKALFIGMIFLFNILYLTAQPASDAPSGNCYDIVLLPEILDTIYKTHYVLKDADIKHDIKTKTIVLRNDTTVYNWIRCYRNKDLENIVWELNTNDDVPVALTTVNKRNRKKIKANLIDTIDIAYEEIVQSKVCECREIKCDVHEESFQRKLFYALQQKNFIDYNVRFMMDHRLIKTALTKYQRQNNLPIGSMDFETLYSLGLANGEEAMKR